MTPITGFTTGNLFIILPVLIQNCKKLFKDYRLEHSEIDSSVDIIVPVSFNFPNPIEIGSDHGERLAIKDVG